MARPEKTETREIGLPKSWWAKLEADARKAERAGADAQIRFLVKSSWSDALTDQGRGVAPPRAKTNATPPKYAKSKVSTSGVLGKPTVRANNAPTSHMQQSDDSKPLVVVEHGGPRGASNRPHIVQFRGAGAEYVIPRERK